MQTISWSCIDKIVYINLARRKDRNIRIKKQLRSLGVDKNRLLRFDAIEEQPGYIGCVKSHIAVLEMAISEGWENVLILEDDIVFCDTDDDKIRLNTFLSTLEKIHWDVAFLAANYKSVVPFASVDYLVRARHAWCACAYLVKKDYLPALVENFRQSLFFLQQGGAPTQFALDVHWQGLMERDCWLGIFPNAGYQACDKSDIEQRSVDYRPLFFKPLSTIS